MFWNRDNYEASTKWAPQKLYYTLYIVWIDFELLLEITESTEVYWEQSGALTKRKTEDSNKPMWLSCITQEATWVKRETVLCSQN